MGTKIPPCSCHFLIFDKFYGKLWITLRDTLNAFDDFESNQKSVWSNVFWHVKVCTFWKCIQYTMHWDKTHAKKFLSGKINGTKNVPSFI